MKAYEQSAAATAIALALASQFEDLYELELFIALLFQLSYAMEVVLLQRKREKLLYEKYCEKKEPPPITGLEI